MQTPPPRRFSRLALIGLAAASLALSGCATGQYEAYAQAQAATAQAKHNAEAERYKALAAIASGGSDTARVAAVMSLAGFGGVSPPQQAPALSAPVDPGTTALQWASILVPTLGQAYAIGQNVKLGMRQSDNSAALGMSTNAAFVGMAGQIQAPAANVTTTTTTLSGAGVIGSGSYSIGPNSGSNSGNSGRIAGQSIYDMTHTPTIVTQPAPIVVKPEVVTPIVVKPEVIKISEVTP